MDKTDSPMLDLAEARKQRPEATSSHDTNADEREATELEYITLSQPVQPCDGYIAGYDTIPQPRSRGMRSSSSEDSIFECGLRFWRRQVSVIVPHKSCKDHLVLVAQLLRLQQPLNTEIGRMTFLQLSLPLAILFQCAAIAVILAGAWRYWRLQNAIIRGKVITASIESIGTGMLVGSLMIVMFAVLLAVEARPNAVIVSKSEGTQSTYYGIDGLRGECPL
ncbi:hypothetical protein FH972_026018 [Carpinus fangiana]|uniref:Uncharacterized protein n=1 Tax=Carpinus fangiana TaxID=176857 RepID=A0A5N6L2Q3_9ROSI|nr:hypothetical protein FH972_026018 [Carpinus fangiana]